MEGILSSAFGYNSQQQKNSVAPQETEACELFSSTFQNGCGWKASLKTVKCNTLAKAGSCRTDPSTSNPNDSSY